MMKYVFFTLFAVMAAMPAIAQEQGIVNDVGSTGESFYVKQLTDRINSLRDNIDRMNQGYADCAAIARTYDIDTNECVLSQVQRCNQRGLVYSEALDTCIPPKGSFVNETGVVEAVQDGIKTIYYDQCILQGMEHGQHSGRSGFGCSLSKIDQREWRLQAKGTEATTRCMAVCFNSLDTAPSPPTEVLVANDRYYVNRVYCDIEPCNGFGMVEMCSVEDDVCETYALTDVGMQGDVDGNPTLVGEFDSSSTLGLVVRCDAKYEGLSQSESNMRQCIENDELRLNFQCRGALQSERVESIALAYNGCTASFIGCQQCTTRQEGGRDGNMVTICTSLPFNKQLDDPSICDPSNVPPGRYNGEERYGRDEEDIPCSIYYEGTSDTVRTYQDICEREGIPYYCRLQEDVPDLILGTPREACLIY